MARLWQPPIEDQAQQGEQSSLLLGRFRGHCTSAACGAAQNTAPAWNADYETAVGAHARRTRGGRLDGLYAQRENTGEAQRWGSRLDRDAECGGQSGIQLKPWKALTGGPGPELVKISPCCPDGPVTMTHRRQVSPGLISLLGVTVTVTVAACQRRRTVRTVQLELMRLAFKLLDRRPVGAGGPLVSPVQVLQVQVATPGPASLRVSGSDRTVTAAQSSWRPLGGSSWSVQLAPPACQWRFSECAAGGLPPFGCGSFNGYTPAQADFESERHDFSGRRSGSDSDRAYQAVSLLGARIIMACGSVPGGAAR